MTVYCNNEFTLLHEKYRPIKIDQILLPPHLKKKFKTIVEKNDIPNMLFFSVSPGVGKTTTAKALANECDVDYMYINTSLERGIDVLRSTISRYAEALSFDGKPKLVILDEFDGATPDLQKAMKASIEEYQESCRFILTANNISAIIEPIQSRVDCIDFNFNDLETKQHMIPSICKHVMAILRQEKIAFDEQQTIADLVINCYPDIRTTIRLIRDCHEQYGSVNKNIFTLQNVNDEFYNLILNKKVTHARRYVMDNNINLTEVYGLIKKNMVDGKLIEDRSKIPQVICTLNEYDFRHAFVSDKELNFAACLFELCKVL